MHDAVNISCLFSALLIDIFFWVRARWIQNCEYINDALGSEDSELIVNIWHLFCIWQHDGMPDILVSVQSFFFVHDLDVDSSGRRSLSYREVSMLGTFSGVFMDWWYFHVMRKTSEQILHYRMLDVCYFPRRSKRMLTYGITSDSAAPADCDMVIIRNVSSSQSHYYLVRGWHTERYT